jgi:hypothetical protein
MYNRDKIIKVMQEIYDESKTISPYVVICQPRRDLKETPAQNFDGHMGLHIDLNGFSHGFCNIGGEVVDVARNYLFERALESGAKYMLFVGEDTVLPYDAFTILHKTAEENPNAVVTGVYYIKLSNAMIMQRIDNHIIIPNVDPGQLIDAWQTGMDVMLIPMHIIKAMKEQDPELPFCCIGNNISPDIPFIGEDNFFVHRLHKMGYKLLVNTDVQCLHMDLASGKYTAHPGVDLRNYFTQIPITTPLVPEDKEYIDKRWTSRVPKGSNSSKNKIQKYLEENKPIKFNIGCGRDKLEGYIGIDKYDSTADINEDIFEVDIPNECAEEILASHLIEHIPHHRGPELMKKWFDNLKPGGKLIMELPDLEGICKAFVEAKTDEEKYWLTVCMYGVATGEETPTEETLKEGTKFPHRWGYYPKVMTELLTEIGFKDIQILPQQGSHMGKNFRVEAIK